MAAPNTGRGNDGTFGRSLMSLIASKLPYNSPSASVIDDVNELNPKYKLFYKTGTRREDLLQKHSVSRTQMPVEKDRQDQSRSIKIIISSCMLTSTSTKAND